VFVGRIEESKGLHLLCKAMALCESPTNLELTVFGNIVDEDYYKRCRSIFNFEHVPPISRSELERRLIDYDVLVLPSLFSEMQSMVLLQSILQNIPVIASDAIGNVELISQFKFGYLFKYNDFVNLSRVITEFYEKGVTCNLVENFDVDNSVLNAYEL
jgi:glycosyltransferase involved in cell wall biosynthesis